MTSPNQRESNDPVIFVEQFRASRLLAGAFWIAFTGWWFALVAFEVPIFGFQLLMLGLGVMASLVCALRFGRRRQFVLSSDGLHLPDTLAIPWQDIAAIQPSPDGSSILVFLFSVPSLNGNRFAGDHVSTLPISIPMHGWSSSPAAVIAGVKLGLSDHLADREAHRASGASYRPDWSDPIDPVDPLDPDPRRVLHDLTARRSVGHGGPAETFKKPTELELTSLIDDLPPGSTIGLQHGRDTEYTLRLVRVGAAYTIESRQGGGTDFRTGPQLRDTAATVALSWARGESEWRHLVPWDRQVPIQRGRYR